MDVFFAAIEQRDNPALKNKIKNDLSLTCSVGIAPIKFLSKIASYMNKQDELTFIGAPGEKFHFYPAHKKSPWDWTKRHEKNGTPADKNPGRCQKISSPNINPEIRQAGSKAFSAFKWY